MIIATKRIVGLSSYRTEFPSFLVGCQTMPTRLQASPTWHQGKMKLWFKSNMCATYQHIICNYRHSVMTYMAEVYWHGYQSVHGTQMWYLSPAETCISSLCAWTFTHNINMHPQSCVITPLQVFVHSGVIMHDCVYMQNQKKTNTKTRQHIFFHHLNEQTQFV